MDINGSSTDVDVGIALATSEREATPAIGDELACAGKPAGTSATAPLDVAAALPPHAGADSVATDVSAEPPRFKTLGRRATTTSNTTATASNLNEIA